MAIPRIPLGPAPFGGFVLDAGLGQLPQGGDGITAHAGGGQANATQLPGLMNRVTVCATTGDSVLLPLALVGLPIVVYNAGAASCNVFASPTGVSGTGDGINAGPTGTAFAVAAGKSAVFACPAPGVWASILSA